jgi:hypothetical protein
LEVNIRDSLHNNKENPDMKNLSFSILTAIISLSLLNTKTLHAQQAVPSSGGQAGKTSISIGQTMYLTHTGSGTASEGVLQVVCSGVTATDTIGCPGETLTQMVPDEVGGRWVIQSSIGSRIDTTGVVTLGFNAGDSNDMDTVLYLLNGCTTAVIVTVYPQPAVNAVNGGPYCQGELGHVYEIGGGAVVSWQWSFPGGFSSSKKYAAVSPASPGDYIVVVTGSNGCTNRDTTTICVSQVANNCETSVDVYLNANGQASFDPSALLGGVLPGECNIAGVVPQGVVALSCDNLAGQGPVFTVSDSLGCEETCTTTVIVKDTIRPVEGCEATQEIVLVWEGTQLFPLPLAEGSDDNCGASNLEFSFSEDFSTDRSRVFDCTEKLVGPVELEVFMRDASGNVSSCMVSVGYRPDSEDCDCTGDNLMLNDNPVSSADYKASQTITSSGTVASGDSVLFKAVQTITLLPGFTAEAGSSFWARTDDCLTVTSGTDLRAMTDSDWSSSETLRSTVYPNPFASAFTLDLDLPEEAPVSMTLHSLDGRMMHQLLRSESMAFGPHRLTIDASRLQAGVYMLRVEAGSRTVSHKILKISNSY